MANGRWLHDTRTIPIDQLDPLPGNPQHLTPEAKVALLRSMARNGFLAPVLVRPRGDRYEVISGNHRVGAARDLAYTEVPCVVADLDDGAARRLAVEMNTIHGEPDTDQLEQFLTVLAADLGDIADLYLGDELAVELADVLSPLDENDMTMSGPQDVELPTSPLGHVLVTVNADQLGSTEQAILQVIPTDAQVRKSVSGSPRDADVKAARAKATTG
jgi:hypothetical protein